MQKAHPKGVRHHSEEISSRNILWALREKQNPRSPLVDIFMH